MPTPPYNTSIFDLAPWMGKRIRFYYSGHEGEGTLVAILGDTALFDNSNASWVWIPAINKVEPWIARPVSIRKVSGKIKINLEELEL